jgi:hypothetical protein
VSQLVARDPDQLPAGQVVQDPAPAPLYVPAAQPLCVALVEPAGQEYPAVHDPLQPALVRPVVEPHVPAGQALQLPARAPE